MECPRHLGRDMRIVYKVTNCSHCGQQSTAFDYYECEIDGDHYDAEGTHVVTAASGGAFGDVSDLQSP